MPKSKPIKLIIDTNLWLSFIISKKLKHLDSLLYSKNVRLLFSKELIDEIDKTIKKPKLRKFFPENSLENMLLAFDPFIDLINIKSKVAICRDPKDDFLLSLAKDGTADYLITGDKDLLVMNKFEQTVILTFKEFEEKLSVEIDL